MNRAAGCGPLASATAALREIPAEGIGAIRVTMQALGISPVNVLLSFVRGGCSVEGAVREEMEQALLGLRLWREHRGMAAPALNLVPVAGPIVVSVLDWMADNDALERWFEEAAGVGNSGWGGPTRPTRPEGGIPRPETGTSEPVLDVGRSLELGEIIALAGLLWAVFGGRR